MKTPEMPIGTPRVVCIVGPTGSGKTVLGIALAKQFHGEVVNADARQIYRDFTIGTGKPIHGHRGLHAHHRVFFVDGVPHYLMDTVAPEKVFSVVAWRDKAMKYIQDIRRRQAMPLIVGGTGLYLQALIDHYAIPHIESHPSFRAAMAEKPLPELLRLLEQMDPEALSIVDRKNPRRVLRALEVVTFSGKSFSQQRAQRRPLVEPLLIGLQHPREELYARADQAIERRLQQGWLEEIKRLHQAGVSFDAPAMTSIGYRELTVYLRGQATLAETIEKIKRATRQYVKRQCTWFKRDPRIQWFKTPTEAMACVQQWWR